MLVKLNYSPSDALRKAHLIETGNRLTDTFVSVELADLPPEQRAVIVQSGIDHSGSVSLPQVATGIDADHYNGPRFAAKLQPAVDAIPSVEEWLALASAALATHDLYQPELDAIIAAKRRAKEEHDKRLAEVQAQYKALQADWLPRIKAMTEAEANAPLPEDVRAVEAELSDLLGRNGRIWNELSAEKSARWKELHDERVKREAHEVKAAWIAQHGSEHLQRAFAREHDCQRKYVLERAAIEAPGYVVDFYNAAAWKDRSCPSEDALNEADAAEKLNIGNVEIVWLTEEPKDTKQSDSYGYEEPFDACEAVVIRNYLGKYDLVKVM